MRLAWTAALAWAVAGSPINKIMFITQLHLIYSFDKGRLCEVGS